MVDPSLLLGLLFTVTTMNKIIVTDPHLLMSIVGPSGSGKTRLLADLLINETRVFCPPFDAIYYYYMHWQPVYEEIGQKNSKVIFKIRD